MIAIPVLARTSPYFVLKSSSAKTLCPHGWGGRGGEVRFVTIRVRVRDVRVRGGVRGRVVRVRGRVKVVRVRGMVRVVRVRVRVRVSTRAS